MSTAKLQGVVLKSINLGENDKIVTILTDKLGKIDAVAHGVRKSKSKMASSVLPFCYGEYMVYKGQNLCTMSQSSIIESFQSIIMDLDLLTYGSYFLELFDAVNEKELPNISMLSLLLKTLYIMTHGEIQLPMLRLVVDFKAISIAGYMPRVTMCGCCRKKMIEGYFSIHEGGIYCDKCRPSSFCYKIDEEAMELLKQIRNIKLENIANIKCSEKSVQYLQSIITGYILHYTEKDLKSISFINKIKGDDFYGRNNLGKD